MKKAWIWVAVAVFVLGGVITKMVLFSPKSTIPQFLLDTKKPIHVLHRSTQIVDMSSMAGGPLTLQMTITGYYVEDVKPEQLIEGLSTATGIKEELATSDHYTCDFGDTSYDLGYSPYANQSGTVVVISENVKPVSTLDVWASRFLPFWTALRFGYENEVPSELGDGEKIPPLDLKRIKMARPKTKFN